MTIWFDTEDLIRFFQNASRPTGIQRLSFETYRAAWHLADADGDVRFCRRDGTRIGLRSIHFPALEAGIMAAAANMTPMPIAMPQQRRTSRIADAARRLPQQYRLPLGGIQRGIVQILDATRDLAFACLKLERAGSHPLPPAATSRTNRHFDLDGAEVVFQRGDWFVNLGASWERPYAPQFLAKLRSSGVGFAMLAHDLIPDLFPEWCTKSMVDDFSAWLHDIVPQTDKMFTVSHNTAADLKSCLQKIGKTIAPASVLPVGSHYTLTPTTAAPILTTPYVLMVGTIEARKNHAAMMRVWRQMLQTMPATAVPTLVFAGKVGWLTADLMQQLKNANWFGGKIRFIDSPSETDLTALYQNCLFSVFPSLYEGWGLPVTESLSFGKTVAASDRSAIPEAGGDFCSYFDPGNTTNIYETIRGLIENPENITKLEARIAAHFHPPSWEDTAAALLSQLGLNNRAIPSDATAPALVSQQR